jgi:hypothetical protein
MENGFTSISRESFAISCGIVAEKKSVCRFVGRYFRMRRMSGRKPMSSMRSASSITSTSRFLKFAYERLMWSRRRPGVATMMSVPRRSACSWAPMPTPP